MSLIQSEEKNHSESETRDEYENADVPPLSDIVLYDKLSLYFEKGIFASMSEREELLKELAEKVDGLGKNTRTDRAVLLVMEAILSQSSNYREIS
jgi:hypothetical protein